MARPDAAKLIGQNLHSLPHPRGHVLRFLEYSRFGKTPEVAAKYKRIAHETGEATIHLLERQGFKVSHRDDPKPADAPGYKTVRVKCALCGKELLAIGVNEDMVATMPRLSLRQLTTIKPECPHE